MFWKKLVAQTSHYTFVCSLVFIGLIALSPATEAAVKVQVTMKNINDWGAGFQVQTRIHNTGTDEINGWTLSFDASFEIQQLWNARIVSHNGSNYVVENAEYNNVIAPNDEVEFGFNATPGGSTMPVVFTVNGDDTDSGSDPDPTPTPGPTPTPELSCATVDENQNIVLTCPAGQVITSVDFASYGTPGGSCGSFTTGSCNASNSVSVVSGACNGKNSCSLIANNNIFGDPCYGTVKKLAAQVACGMEQDPTPTPTPKPTPVPIVCNDNPTYGPRELKLLTRLEYQNSLEDLVGIDFNVADSVPFDTLIEGYFNNAFTPVSESHADAYLSVAKKVSAWSAQRNFQGVVDCGFDSNGNMSMSYQECENLFLSDFGSRVFRRPLTSAELSTYQAVFDNNLTGGDIKVGLELGMSALLSSPRFLYRSEAGTSVQNLLNGNGSDTVDEATVNGADFQIKSTGSADGSSWNIWSNGYIQNNFTLADDALIRINMKGDVAQNVWPEMELAIDDTVVATRTIGTSNYQDYEFSFIGYGGSHQVQIRFTNDYYGNGEDRNLYVQSVTVSGTQSDEPPVADLDLSTLDSDAYVLSNYEIASFLSYTFTGSTPDEVLLTAASHGELSTQAQLQHQAARLLATDKAKEHMGVFVAQWLGSDEIIGAQKDSTLFPDFTPEIGKAMAAEVKAFFTHVFYDDSQTFSDLFSADYVFVNKPLASYYGLGDVGTNSNDPKDFVKVDATNAHRGGLMTMGAFLANEADLTKSSPIKRAANVRIRILCQDIPQPDGGIPDLRIELMEALLKELDGKVITTREFIAEITKNSPCSYCHDEIINPLGFTFEDYDASGRYITVDHNGLSIDSSGMLIGVDSMNDGKIIDFTGGKDLSNKFAQLESVQACFSANVFRYAMDIGHDAIDAKNDKVGELTDEEKADYECSVDALSETLATSNSMSDLFSRLGTLDLVRFRKQRDR
jgi:hypothetical protein